MKYLAAALIGFLFLGSASTAFAETPPPDPIGGFDFELPPELPPFPVPPLPLPEPPGPFPVPPWPFPFPFPGPGDLGIDTGSVTAALHVECVLAEFNVWVGIENTTDDPAVVTVDSPFMDSELVVVAPHDGLVVPVGFDHIEHNTIAVTAEFDGSMILDDEQSIACLAPNVSYDLHYDCDSGLADISLVNDGLLASQMGYVVAPGGPMMHTIYPGGNKEVALPHGEGEYLEMDVIADGETLFHGVWGFDCPDAPVGPEAEPEDAAPIEEEDTPVPEPTATPDSGKLADDSEVVPVDLGDVEDDGVQDGDTQDGEAGDDPTADESATEDAQPGPEDDEAPDGGSRSAAPALILVSLLGAGGVAGATAWGRR